ncbi:NDR1/HIN1-like protein 26 [Silene latifolia]|uniref:NDR1/HIN1-like protein 26 n=1 Tax=Silene latifolia TaxID=37657 RepID=UPI003D76ED93
MSQIDIRSPKHCAKKGFHFNFKFLNNKLFKILLTLTFSLLSLFLLLWFILHPSKPEFILQEIDVYQLNFSSTYLLNSSIGITLESRNPNQRVGIYYDELHAHATYKKQQITLDTFIPQFYQGNQDSDLLSASLIGNGLPIPPSLGYEVGRDQAAGKLVLRVTIKGIIRWKVATWVSGRYMLNVNCVTILPLGPLNPMGSLSSKQGTQCSTKI